MYLQIILITFTNNKSTSPFLVRFLFLVTVSSEFSLAPWSRGCPPEQGPQLQHHIQQKWSLVGTVHGNIESIHIPVQYQINSNHIKALSLQVEQFNSIQQSIQNPWQACKEKSVGLSKGFLNSTTPCLPFIMVIGPWQDAGPYGAAGSEVRTTQTVLTSKCRCLNISQKFKKKTPLPPHLHYMSPLIQSNNCAPYISYPQKFYESKPQRSCTGPHLWLWWLCETCE